jgi:hypothetical protein
MREGIRNVEKNYESFEMSSQLLKNNEVLCLMPEGGQDEGRTLRPLQKGICRIAFKAQQEMGLDRSLYIVPVGIDYSDYEHSGSNLTVNFGKPISVAWYYNLEPNKAQQKLRSDLTEAMKKQMIHFENNSNYDNLYALMKIYAPRLKEIMLTMQVDDTSNFAVEKMFSEVFTYITAENTESFTNLSMHTSTYFNALNEMGLSDNDLVQSRVPLSKLLLKTCVALFTIPVAIYGFINSFLAILVLHFSLRAFADRQFYSTIRFVVGGVVFPLIYLIQTLIVGCFINNIWVALGYFVSLPLTALFMNWFKGNYGHLPVIYTLKALSRQKGSGLNMLQQLRNQIIRLTDEFIITHSKAQAAKQ